MTLTYDGFGRTLTVTNGVTTTSYGYTSGTTYPGYDDQNEPLNIQTSYFAANGTTVLFSKAVGYSYNADGSRAGMTTPAGSFTYAYDGDARPTSVTNPFGETASWTYYQNNLLMSQTLGNGAYSTYTYNARNLLTSLVNSASGGGELSNFSSLVHDSVGNLGSISAVVDSEPATYSGSTTYTYDNADELKQEASHRNGTYTNNFSYDAAQNPTTSRNVSGKTYNGDNQATNTGYAFDGSGNPTTYGGATLAFDPENRLTKYGASTMSATYDATSLRASKTKQRGHDILPLRRHDPTATYGKHNAVSRFSKFKTEFDEMLSAGHGDSAVPSFLMLRLMSDHTAGMSSSGPTPMSHVADNDYAVGQVVSLVSHSKVWEHTAIFVIEDDAQDGPDHVDCHRSTCYVISPYIKAATVDHTFHNTDSVLRTMEILLGLNPLSQYDAIANPILDFTASPENNAPYTPLPENKSIIIGRNPTMAMLKHNPELKHLVALSNKMDFVHPDSAPAKLLNEIVWKSVKGVHSKMPAARHTLSVQAIAGTRQASAHADFDGD